jgi:prolyl oligopeptidase
VRRPPHLALLSASTFAGLVACGGGAADSRPTTPLASVPAVAPPAATPPPAGPAKPEYPATAKRPVVDLYRDVRVSDDYRWLEDWNDPSVQAWSETENAFARRWLDAAPGRTAIHARIEQLMSDSSPSWGGLTARRGAYFALERRPPKQQPYLVVFKSLDDAKSGRVLVDPSVLDASGGTAIGWFVPSPDGKRVAVSLSKGGGERGDVHLFEVATGKALKDVVPQADGAGSGDCLAWKGDGSGFFYTRGRSDGEAQNAYQRIQFHKLGDAVDKDAVVLGKDAPRIAQWELASGGDGRSVVARMENGDSGEWDQWLLGPSGKWVQIATKADGVKGMDVGPDGALYLVSAKDAPRRKLLRTSLTAPSLDKAEVIVPEGDAVLSEIVPLESRIYLNEDLGGIWRIRSVPMRKGRPGTPTTLATPAISTISGLAPLGGDDVAFASMSYTQPTAFYRVSGKDGSLTKTALAATSVADFSGIDVTREECTSKDGTKVPLTVLRAKSTAANRGDAPTLLTGYGGYSISISPRFRPHLLAWLEQGGVYAVANIRGGGEFGEAWHSGGTLTNKQNVFDDFYACAQHLVDAKYTTPARLAIQGGSNGGLLMGAELTQHPEAFKAVVSSVGIYDMLRNKRDSNGAFNVAEYGSVTDPKQFDALYAYSPYHHVKDGVAYPAVLFMTGANDPRVAPYHSRKMTARLQAATSSDAPILLRTSAHTGHGIGSPLSAQIDETTDIYAFLFAELGVSYAAKSGGGDK